MRRDLTIATSTLTLLALAGSAPAQPGRSAPAPAPAYAQPTPEEQRLLAKGEYDEGQIIAGGLVGTFLGFGTGHIVQGRWLERGWIFTFGEAAMVGVFTYGMVDCFDDFDVFEDDRHDDDTGCVTMAIGLVGAGIFRIAELVDVWRAPFVHNRRVRAARERTRAPSWSVYAAPARGSGATGGVAFRF